MGLKVASPTSPGRRGFIGHSFEELTKKEPEKSLLLPLKKTGGRNNQGKITVRHHGGGAKQKLRIIDFKRNKIGVPGKVAAIEYDPTRSARLALIHYADGDKRYILCPIGLAVGDTISAGAEAPLKPGNALPLKLINQGMLIHNIELQPNRGAQLVRSAGAAAQLMAKEDSYVQVRMPSGEVRRVLADCMATIGQVGNEDHQNIRLSKAGQNRWRGWRPSVRGAVMSPRDHPHGGGEGKNSRGMNPKTPWGKPALGYKTRGRKPSDKMIISRRK